MAHFQGSRLRAAFPKPEMSVMQWTPDKERGETMARAMCILLFEGDMAMCILRRWLRYPPRPFETMKANLRLLLSAVCTSPVCVEFSSMHLQIFDSPYLRIFNETVETSALLMNTIRFLCAYFRGQCVNNAQREITLRAFVFDDLLECSISRSSILQTMVKMVLTDAIKTHAYVAVRDALLMTLTDLYAETSALPISNVIARTIASMRVPMDAETSIFRFPQPNAFCALVNPRECVFHQKNECA
jgi:hypothetical protein